MLFKAKPQLHKLLKLINLRDSIENPYSIVANVQNVAAYYRHGVAAKFILSYHIQCCGCHWDCKPHCYCVTKDGIGDGKNEFEGKRKHEDLKDSSAAYHGAKDEKFDTNISTEQPLVANMADIYQSIEMHKQEGVDAITSLLSSSNFCHHLFLQSKVRHTISNFTQWCWSNPVMICDIEEGSLGLQVWNYSTHIEGREIISNHSKAAGLTAGIAEMRPEIDYINEYVRTTTAKAFIDVSYALMPFFKAVGQSKKPWHARHPGIKIVQHFTVLSGCVVLPHLSSLVEIIEHSFNYANQKVRTNIALSLANLAEAAVFQEFKATNLNCFEVIKGNWAELEVFPSPVACTSISLVPDPIVGFIITYPSRVQWIIAWLTRVMTVLTTNQFLISDY